MAFLQRIVNGGGRIEREMALGNGRTDVAVFWKDQVAAVELKMRYDNYSRADGLRQIAGYLDRLGQQHGYLVLFDKRPAAELPWDERVRWTEEEHVGKRITVVELFATIFCCKTSRANAPSLPSSPRCSWSGWTRH